MPAMAIGKFDTRHLRQEWFPRLDRLLSSAHFAKNRYRVQRVCVCAIVLSQDEGEIRLLNKQMPMFSVTQDKLDWQPEEDQSVGDVFTHLTRMSDCQGHYLFGDVESPEYASSPDSEQERSYYRQSFRLSSLEVYNGDCSSPGYHVGATGFQKLTNLRDSSNSDELWRKWLNKYIIEFDESPRILWAREGVKSAVLWQVQLDIIDSTSRFRNSGGGIRRKRYGAFSQVYVDSREEHAEDGDEPEAKRYRGVRYRPERKKWVAEMRLPKGLKKNKVSFGDYESEVQAARAVDVAFHHYGKEVNFRNTAEILKAQPALEGLEGEAKLRWVKDQAKWVANQALNQAPLQLAGAPSTATAKTPDAASSQDSTAVPDIFMFSPNSPSISLESLLEDYGSEDEGSSTRAQLVVAPEHGVANMDVVVNESGSFGDQTGLSMLQFCCSVGSDPSDLLAICSPSSNSTLLPLDSPQLLSFQDDVADHRMWEPENFQFWSPVYEQDSLFSGL